MLEPYLFPISYAFMTFPIAAAFFTLPFLIVQYRRHGYIHKYRALILYLFLLYMMNALYLIVLPLPASIHNLPPKAVSYYQLIPFHFVMDIIRETSVRPGIPSTYWHLLKERAFLQVVFNVALTVPFGMFLRHYLRAHWVRCLVVTFMLSLFFEVTQVTGIYGIYDYPYRLFDVDDLITNTLGGMIGLLAAEWFAKILPRVDRLDEHVDLSTKRVSYTRRGIAFCIDWFVLSPFLTLLAILQVPYPFVIGVILYFIILPYVTNGHTLGKWIVRIRVKGQGERLTAREVIVRYGLFYLVLGGLNQLLFIVASSSLSPILIMIYALGMFVVDVLFGIHLLRCMFNRERQLFYEAKSHTTHIII
ncbi:teicoplanin resistance protein VanZ [Paenibacillus selenitireducens]|uniref:Teicoplanin resistance protein VanZ n=1 Tax=Paenibacillus selenitireducens TaxID=1324314 RepID=A0A1T2XHY2_9BACL|nr:VanZ family protein [Paenibacillus selenitireducens]OPA79507.1 teicoplanin resistance protein VanZ [Paenibacillus selenitireducens]